jgi:type VII secretion-associated serine protease mycosin
MTSRFALIALSGALVAALPLSVLAAQPAGALSSRSAGVQGTSLRSARPKSSHKPVKPKPTPSTHKKPPKPPAIPVPKATEPHPSANCPAQAAATRRVTTEPWAQRALDFSSVWGLTQGAGVKVAVVDSGVDYNRQLAGKVTAIDLTHTGTQDCQGHGTMVAGLIAARPIRGLPFSGVAPAATILSVKVQNSYTSGSNGVATLAQGIYDAAYWGAKVINVSITTKANSPALLHAVQYALGRGAVVVAAAGNDLLVNGTVQKGPYYPASYPGVLSVGAVGRDGGLLTISDRRSHADVTAPGIDILSTYPGGYSTDYGTSFATAFVSGVAALIRSRYPAMPEKQVVNRIEQTADGGSGPATGHGLVNPLQAVTAVLPNGPAAASPTPSLQHVSVVRALGPDRLTREIALTSTAGSLGLAVLVAVGAIVIRSGRRRGWHPGGAGAVGGPERPAADSAHGTAPADGPAAGAGAGPAVGPGIGPGIGTVSPPRLSTAPVPEPLPAEPLPAGPGGPGGGPAPPPPGSVVAGSARARPRGRGSSGSHRGRPAG